MLQIAYVTVMGNFSDIVILLKTAVNNAVGFCCHCIFYETFRIFVLR